MAEEKKRFFLCQVGKQTAEAIAMVANFVTMVDAVWSYRPDVSTCELWQRHMQSKIEMMHKFRARGFCVKDDAYRQAWWININ